MQDRQVLVHQDISSPLQGSTDQVWISLPKKGEQLQEISPALRPATIFIPLYCILKLFLQLALNTLFYSSPDIDSSFGEINVVQPQASVI